MLKTLTNDGKATRAAAPRTQLPLILLLFLIAAINYFDRQSLSVVAPHLQAELHIDDLTYGHIVGLFLLASAIAYAIAGFVTDWIGTRRAMALFVGLWSVAEASTALAFNALSLGVARFCLGLGEPGLWVAAPKAVGEAVGERRRALTIGIYSMGGSVGAVVALPVIAFLMGHIPLRSVFVIDGAAGILWLPLWFWVTRGWRPAQSASQAGNEQRATIASAEVVPNLRAILTRSATWRLVAARGLTDPVWYFYLFWFPKYLVSSRHMTLDGMAHFAWFVYVGGSIGAVTGGIFANFLIRRGMRVRIAYRWTMLAAALLLPLSPLTAAVPSGSMCVLIASVIAFAHMNWLVMLTAVVVELYPSHQVGTAAGLIASGSGLGGMVSSELIGLVVMHHGYTPLFFVMGILHPLVLVGLWSLFEGLEPASKVRLLKGQKQILRLTTPELKGVRGPIHSE